MAGSENTAESFRVRVSLEHFFADERARCYVSVRGARRVRWLARRLRALFPLPRRLALLSRGHLLPPDEPLALLRPDDPVQVIPSTVECDETDNCKLLSTNVTIEASTPESVEPACKKRKKILSFNRSANLNVAVNATSTGHATAKKDIIESESDRSPQYLQPATQCIEKPNKIFFNSDSEHPVQFDSTSQPLTESLAHEETRVHQIAESKSTSDPQPTDFERMCLLKEQALAALERVAARPRRRVRVRRRRRRPLDPLPDCSADAPIEAADDSPGPGPPTAQASSDGGDSSGSPTPDARAGAVPAPGAGAAPGSPPVLRNAPAAPRAARLVRPLPDAAPLPL